MAEGRTARRGRVNRHMNPMRSAPASRAAAVVLACAACAPPAPTLLLPTAPVALHAEPLELTRLLGPTALGASSEVLCPWARGEPIPDASLARWLAEKRLVFRVIEVGEVTSFAGSPLSAAGGVAEAARALEQRCDARISDDYLVAAGPDVAAGLVFDGIHALGKVGFATLWLLVTGLSADAAGPASPVSDRPPPTGTPRISGILGSKAGRSLTVVAEDPVKVFDEAGPLDIPLADALATRPECVIMAARPSARWGSVAELAGLSRGVAADVMLARVMEESTPDRPPSTPAPAIMVMLRDRVPALRITTPTLGGSRCGAGPVPVEEPPIRGAGRAGRPG